MSIQRTSEGETSHMDEALLREAQHREFARINRVLENLNEAFQQMNTRMQTYERSTTIHGEPREEEDHFEDVTTNEPRGMAREGRGRGRAQEHPIRGRYQGYEEGVDRNLGNIKLELP